MVASQPSPIDALEILHEMREIAASTALLTAALVRVVGIPSRW